jgi:8-oxo-dGTP diphosphatase
MKTFGIKEEGVNYIKRPGVYAVIRNHGQQVALVKTPGGYFLPGGGIKAGESHRECLERELAEELGWQIEIQRYIGCAQRYFFATVQATYYCSIGYFYTAHKLAETETVTEENHEEAWLTIEEIESKLLHEHQLWAVKQSFR